MENNSSQRSVEELHHFSCAACNKWWTIGDAPKEKATWHCPWCGKEQQFSHGGH